MAARRGKSQARRHGNSGLPGWAWLVIGVLATLLVVLAAPRLLTDAGDGDGFFRPTPNPEARPAATDEAGEAIAPDTLPDKAAAQDPGRPKATQYDFYTLLPGQEVAVSDAELAASAKAEAEARDAQAVAPVDPALAGREDDALPAPIAETRPPGAPPPATPAASPPASPAPAAEAAAAEARYVLQAGAFGASGDAEAVKARVALLGLNARVESAQIRGKTVYRVRMGPYGSASELAAAKSTLAAGGMAAIAIRTN